MGSTHFGSVMKTAFNSRKARVLAPLFAATALVATPVFAQETAAPQAAPVVTPPSSATVPIPPAVRTVPDGTPPAASSEPAPAPRAKPAPRATTATRATRTVTRSTTTTTRTAAPAAPVAATPEPAAPAPQPAAPQASTQPAAPVADTAPVNEPAPPAADSAASTTTTTVSSGIPIWAWAAGGIALLAIILGALVAMRRRREDDYVYDEPVYAEPEPYIEPVAAAPVAAAPVIQPVPVAKAEPRKEPEYLRRTAAPLAEPVVAAPDEVHVESAASDDVAALTGGETVAERPWLEFAMRPVRAGTNVDEALVEIELTVGNAGSVQANDVRISTFLLSGDPRGSEMERLLLDLPADATADPVNIKPGEGKRIDATLALLKSQMGEVLPDTIRPIVVADARYTLADGSEGRTSASFVIGVTDEDGAGLEPIELSRSSMHDNVVAALHGQPQHA